MIGLLGLVMLSACSGREVIGLELEAPEGARGMIVALERRGVLSSVVAIDPGTGAGRDALPVIDPHGALDEVRVTALFYAARSLEELGLAPGSVLAATAGEPSRALPFESGQEAVVHGSEAGDWAPITELPPALQRFMLPGRCFPPQVPVVPFLSPSDPAFGREVCVPPPPAPLTERCWSTPEPIAGASSEKSQEQGGAIVEDAGGRWLYFTTSRFHPDGYTAHARVPIDRRGEVTGMVERLASGDIGGDQAIGWNGPPRPASTREVVFNTSRPDAEWWLPRIGLASRPSESEPWTAGAVIESIRIAPGSRHAWPVLLPDARTLVFFGIGVEKLRWARRPRAEPGTIDFFFEGDTGLYEPLPHRELASFALSCDGRHLTYLILQEDGPPIPRIVPLLGFEERPLFGEPRDYPLDAGSIPLEHFAEGPRCELLLLSDVRELYRARPCP